MTSSAGQVASQARVWRHRRRYRLGGVVLEPPSCDVFKDISRATYHWWRSDVVAMDSPMIQAAFREFVRMMREEINAKAPGDVLPGASSDAGG